MKSFRSTISLVASLFFAAGSLFAQAPLNGGGIWSDVDEQAMTSSGRTESITDNWHLSRCPHPLPQRARALQTDDRRNRSEQQSCPTTLLGYSD